MSSEASAAGAPHEHHRSVEELERQLAEAHQREAATYEVLKSIGRSTFDLQKVLDTLTEAAARLCGADKGLIRRREGDYYVLASTYGFSDEFKGWVATTVLAAGRGSVVGRVALERKTVHIPDVFNEPDWERGDWQRLGDFRSMIGVPLLRDGDILGILVLHRTRVAPFTEKQIELVETFADQAVIAIENTRLFAEVQARTRDLTESLEQQTTTADVLKVISRSALDVQKVLDALVESAARLCNAYDAAIFQVVGDSLRLVAHHGQIPTTYPVGQQLTLPLVRGFVGGRAVIDRRTIQVEDVLAEADEYPESQKYALQLGFRTTVCVPLVHAGKAIGVLVIRRAEVRPFTDRQIELVNTFADQAVIAIENTRLFEAEQASKLELQEALEYQTATSDVLDVISRTPNELQPVFDAIVETAARLCHAESAHVFTLREGLYHLAASNHGEAEFKKYLRQNPIAPGQRGSVTAKAAAERRTIHVPDTMVDPDTDYGSGLLTISKNRTVLSVPLMRDDEAIGVITLARKQPKPFADKHIHLVTTFADQAVIAIANARLFEEVQARTKELQESLEYQTATSDVLQVISSSPGKLQPVYETMLAKALLHCN